MSADEIRTEADDEVRQHAQTTSQPDPDRVSIFEAVYEQHQASVLRYCLSRLHSDKDSAQDITQNVFMELLKALNEDKVRDLGKVQGWLLGTASHKIVDHFRKNARVDFVEDIIERDPRVWTDIHDHPVPELLEVPAAVAHAVVKEMTSMQRQRFANRSRHRTGTADLLKEIKQRVGSEIIVHEQDGHTCGGLQKRMHDSGVRPGVLLTREQRETLNRHISHCPRCSKRRANAIDKVTHALLPLLLLDELRHSVPYAQTSAGVHSGTTAGRRSVRPARTGQRTHARSRRIRKLASGVLVVAAVMAGATGSRPHATTDVNSLRVIAAPHVFTIPPDTPSPPPRPHPNRPATVSVVRSTGTPNVAVTATVDQPTKTYACGASPWFRFTGTITTDQHLDHVHSTWTRSDGSTSGGNVDEGPIDRGSAPRAHWSNTWTVPSGTFDGYAFLVISATQGTWSSDKVHVAASHCRSIPTHPKRPVVTAKAWGEFAQRANNCSGPSGMPFYGTVSSDQTSDITYHWKRGDGTTSTDTTVHLTANTTSALIKDDHYSSTASFLATDELVVTSPASATSGAQPYVVICASGWGLPSDSTEWYCIDGIQATLSYSLPAGISAVALETRYAIYLKDTGALVRASDWQVTHFTGASPQTLPVYAPADPKNLSGTYNVQLQVRNHAADGTYWITPLVSESNQWCVPPVN